MGAFDTLYYALNLNDPACPPTAMEADREVAVQAVEPVPAGAVFVAPAGGVGAGADSAGALAGSEAYPFATIQFALDACSDRDDCSAVVLRGGTHFLKETIVVTPRHSHTRLMAYPGEAPVVSGGTPLTNLQWKPYGTPKPPPNSTWMVEANENAVYGHSIDNKTYFLLGLLDDVQECQDAATKGYFNVFTYHDTTVEPQYQKQCWGFNGTYSPTQQSGHTSGVRNGGVGPTAFNAYVVRD
jgi:hypothetical protein